MRHHVSLARCGALCLQSMFWEGQSRNYQRPPHVPPTFHLPSIDVIGRYGAALRGQEFYGGDGRWGFFREEGGGGVEWDPTVGSFAAEAISQTLIITPNLFLGAMILR
jgi:hypothetical protein